MAIYRFCPACGHRLVEKLLPHEHHPQLVCEHCGRVCYRNSKPCAGALVVRESRVLLARRAVEPFLGHWDIPGGFLENGEHPADGARREILEETGLEVRLGDLLGMYIDRYGPDGEYTLNLYFLAEIVGGTMCPADDVDSLAWFGPHELPELIAFAHAHQVLADWCKSLEPSNCAT